MASTYVGGLRRAALTHSGAAAAQCLTLGHAHTFISVLLHVNHEILVASHQLFSSLELRRCKNSLVSELMVLRDLKLVSWFVLERVFQPRHQVRVIENTLPEKAIVKVLPSGSFCLQSS